MLAGELALAGVDVAIVELRKSQALDGSRAGGLHARTIEVLDQRGVADRFVSQGTTYPAVSFARVPLDISDVPSRHNYLLGLLQNRFDEIFAGFAACSSSATGVDPHAAHAAPSLELDRRVGFFTCNDTSSP